MAESRYNRKDNQAPVQTQLEASKPKVGRSVFNFSTIHSGNAFFGALIPVDCFDVVPGESLSISMANLLELRNPTTRQLLNGCRVYFHCYYNRLTDLWEGAQNFVDTGRSGDINLKRPNLIYHVDSGDSFAPVNSCTPMSLLNYLGLPVEAYTSSTPDNSVASPLWQFKCSFNYSSTGQSLVKVSESVDFFPADCAFAYQRNWRDFYCNKNLLQNNKYWFPDNEDHFILSYSCENAVAINYEDEDFSASPVSQVSSLIGPLSSVSLSGKTLEPNNPATVPPSSGFSIEHAPNLSGLKFRQFRGDRFSTSLPFPDLIRGDIPVIELSKDKFVHVSSASSPDFAGYPIDGSAPGSSGDVTFPYDVTTGTVSFNWQGSNHSLSVPLSDLTMDAIRELETMTVFKERMARTSGDYNDMIEAQYGVSPHVHDRKGTYVGGFYQDFAFSSVTQLSQSDQSPLGTKAGQGVSSGSGTVCNGFDVPDFGWIQIYMSIVPDVYYTQGKPRMFDKKVQTDMYFPIFNNLAPQYIKNKELFVSGTVASDDAAFGYEDRYAEYKSRPNRVSGFMSLSPKLASFDSARIMARRFSSTPALNNNFVSMIPENMDMSVFTVEDEPPFDFSCGISVRRVFPGPYTAVPGSLSSGLHA